jgi:hypothetical protein
LRALRIGERRVKAAGRELIETVLSGDARTLTLALIADIDDERRLAILIGDVAPSARSLGEVLGTIAATEPGGPLAALSARYAAEVSARPPVPNQSLWRVQVTHA